MGAHVFLPAGAFTASLGQEPYLLSGGTVHAEQESGVITGQQADAPAPEDDLALPINIRCGVPEKLDEHGCLLSLNRNLYHFSFSLKQSCNEK